PHSLSAHTHTHTAHSLSAHTHTLHTLSLHTHTAHSLHTHTAHSLYAHTHTHTHTLTLTQRRMWAVFIQCNGSGNYRISQGHRVYFYPLRKVTLFSQKSHRDWGESLLLSS